MRMNRLIPMLPVKSMPGASSSTRSSDSASSKGMMIGVGPCSRFDDCRLMVDQSINLHAGAPRQGVLYLYPESIVEYHQQVRRNGLAVPDLDNTFYGQTEFRLDDPDGNRLWIGQHTSTEAR